MEMKSKLVLNGIAAAVMALGATASWGQSACFDTTTGTDVDICIGAVPTIQNALAGDSVNPGLIAQFQASAGAGLTIGVVYASSGVLLNNIETALAAGNDSPYDLYLAADVADPATLVGLGYADVGTPEDYAEGQIMVWSNGNTYSFDFDNYVDPTDYTNNATTIGICNPSTGPYGAVALAVLNSHYGIPSTDIRINRSFAMINAVDAAVVAGGGAATGVQSGWVPTALHCTSGGVVLPDTLPDATYQAFTTADAYSLQDGVAIQSSRGSQRNAQTFLDWIANSTEGQPILKNFCLQIISN